MVRYTGCVFCAHREYYKTLQCLHDSLVKCTYDESHLNVIASRIGHLRTFMQQTCSSSATIAVDRHPLATVTSRRPDDVIDEAGPVTRPMATRRADDSGVDGDWSGCSRTTAGAPRSQPLHGSATQSVVASLSTSVVLASATILAVLRPHGPA